MIALDEPERLNIPLVVHQITRHAGQLSTAYEWPVARQALVRVLTDLEARGDDPSLEILRRIIQREDRKFEASHEQNAAAARREHQ